MERVNYYSMLIVTAILLLLVVTRVAGADGEAALSPYFYVQDGESNPEAFPLLDTNVDVEISGVIARVTVVQTYANRGTQAIHARYVFPGSSRAAVHDLVMTVGGRVIRAQIREREAARQAYAAARLEGKSASLLEQQRPNVFSMEVANILPGDTIKVELTYSELLTPEDGKYAFVYPTVVGPRYAGAPQEQDGNQWAAAPYLPEGVAPQTKFAVRVRLAAGMPVQDIVSDSHRVKVDYQSEETALVSLEGTEFGGDRDFILHYRLAGEEIAAGLLLYQGQSENIFLLMAEPPQRPEPEIIPGREYIFVVDVSGSMFGFPLDTAKLLLKDLIGALRPEDRFNLIFFSGANEILAPSSLAATSENIQKAVHLLDSIGSGGGTELLPALRRALDLKAVEGYARSLVLITDGYISAEPEVFELINDNLGQANVFAFGIGGAVNRHLIEGLAKAGRGEPFVVTDPAEAPGVARQFAEYMSSPVLTDIRVKAEGVRIYDLEPQTVPDLFAARPIMLIGKWRGEPTGTIAISGRNGQGVYTRTFDLSKVKPAQENVVLRYLWARERLARLTVFGGEQRNQDAITQLGLQYNLLTAYTSFVAVDEVVRNQGGQGDDVTQPLPLPQGVSEYAVGASPGATQVPEPEFWLLLALGVLAVAACLPVRQMLIQAAERPDNQ